MMPEEWPIAAPAADGNAPARGPARGRLATVRRDFFLDPAKRLTEQERALMTAMLHCLVSDVAAALRAALPSRRVAANDESDAALIELLTASGLLDDHSLMALLLRRADEERIASAARARSGRREARVLQALVSHDDGGAAAAAMALVLARGRRRDRFGQCLITFDDLSEAGAQALVQAIAAALRSELATGREVSAADSELTEACRQVLAHRDEARGVDALTTALVQALDRSSGVSDALVLSAANEGEVAFVADVLARRAGVPAASAIDELLSGEAQHIMALLRAAGVSRDVAAGLLAGIGDLLGIDDAASAIDMFDMMSERQVESARSWLQTAPGYRSALERLGQGRG